MKHIIYKLQPSEYHRYKNHLLNLDEESRYLRFGFHIRNETIAELVDRWQQNYNQNIVFVIENDDLDVVAVGHISLEDGPAELAFSVLKPYQKQGMGDALMKRAVEHCQNRGIKTGCMVCLSTNEAIKHLVRKHGIQAVNEHGEALARLEMPAPTPVSYWHEYVEDSVSKIDHLGKAQRKFAKMFRFPLLF